MRCATPKALNPVQWLKMRLTAGVRIANGNGNNEVTKDEISRAASKRRLSKTVANVLQQIGMVAEKSPKGRSLESFDDLILTLTAHYQHNADKNFRLSNGISSFRNDRFDPIMKSMEQVISRSGRR